MSEQSGGPGWWLASDGQWYPSVAEVAPVVPAATDAAGTEMRWDGTRWVDPASGQWWDGTRWNEPHPPTGQPVVSASSPSPAPGPAPDPRTADAVPLASEAATSTSLSNPVSGTPGSSSGRGVLVVVGIVGVVALLVAGFVVIRSRDSGPSLTTDVVADGAAASGPDEMPSPDLTLTDQTVVVRGNGGSTLKAMAADGSTLTLDGSADGVDRLEAGSVLLLTGVTVVKVTEVRSEGEDVIVATEAAAIGEVIRDGSLSWDEVSTSAASLQVWEAGPDDLEISDGATTDDDGEEEGARAAEAPRPGPVALRQDGSSGRAADPSGATDPWHEARHVMAAASAPSSGAAFLSPTQADPISKSGKVGDFTYSFEKVSGADGSSSYKLGLTKEGNYVLRVDLDAQIDTIISSGDLTVANSTLDSLHLRSNKFNGTAKLSISAGTGETITPVKQEIVSIPVSITFPLVVYGIPFSLTVKGKFLIEPAFTSKNATVSGRAEVTFGGTAGLTYQDGSLSAEGAMTQKGANPMEYVDGLGVGVTGIVFAAQFPRLGFGLGYGGASAGVYLASTTSAGITVASSIGMVPCNSISITNTTSAGAEAAFMGLTVPVAKSEISKETWNYYAPDSEACRNLSGN